MLVSAQHVVAPVDEVAHVGRSALNIAGSLSPWIPRDHVMIVWLRPRCVDGITSTSRRERVGVARTKRGVCGCDSHPAARAGTGRDGVGHVETASRRSRAAVCRWLLQPNDAMAESPS